MKDSSTGLSRDRTGTLAGRCFAGCVRSLPALAILTVILIIAPRVRIVSSASLAQGAIFPIHDIQGSGSISPLAGQSVTTSGIVTAIKSNGFFLQAPDSEIDADPNTSEGVFVFTSSAPRSSAAVGSVLRIAGSVVEFRPSSDPNSPPLTEIHPAAIESLGNGPLPAPVTITTTDLSGNGSIEQLEKFEGMRVRVNSLVVVAPTGGTVTERTATASSNGVFFGVIAGTARPFREPGVQVPDPLPLGAPCCVPRFDANPELLRVDSDGQQGTSPLNVTTGTMISNLAGVLDYSFRAYTILPDPGTFGMTPGIVRAVPLPSPEASEFTVASFNLERFFDTTDDPGVSDVALTAQAFSNRLNKASLAIRNVMRSPDIIGVEEVENLATLQAIADKLNADAVADGETNPLYIASLTEGNDPGGIDVGFLVKNSRVVFNSAAQVGKSATYTNPNNGQQDTLNDRPPLVLRAAPIMAGGSSLPITVIVNHLRSLSGIDDPADGARVRAKRRAQAEFLANLLQQEQQADPSARIICLGDFNSFQFNDGWADVMGTITGNPTPASNVMLASADLVNPNFTDVIDLLPADQRYSYVFNGSAQALDHVLVSQTLLPRVSRFAYARLNADFAETFRNDASRPERVSDHDAVVAYFKFQSGSADLGITASASPNPVPRNTTLTYTVNITNFGPDTATGVSLRDSFFPFGIGFGVNTIAPGQTRTIRIATLPSQAVGEVVTNTFTVSSNQVDPVPLNDSATVIVTVGPPAPRIEFVQIDGKNLLVTGQGFDDGAKVEINGEAVKTNKGDQIILQTLIAKRGGKRIAPGETATIVVANGDGSRSAPFPFTRPVS